MIYFYWGSGEKTKAVSHELLMAMWWLEIMTGDQQIWLLENVDWYFPYREGVIDQYLDSKSLTDVKS